jgi:hypothetical protein
MTRARTVSNLTEEQIQQKRSIDRKAQRAFRQRTKDCISDLEGKIVELGETSSLREAQLLQEVENLREHNVTLVRCLESIARTASQTVSPRTSGAGLHTDHGIQFYIAHLQAG